MSEGKHTPTPWKAVDIRRPEAGRYGDKEGWDIWHEDGKLVVALSPNAGACGEADAKHIVQCVNSHDQIVEALKEIKARIELGWILPDKYVSEESERAWDECLEAFRTSYAFGRVKATLKAAGEEV